jgi:putative membrane protein
MMGFGMGFGAIAMVLFWGVIIALIAGGVALLVRQAGGYSPFAAKQQPIACQILDERLARGEISREEFDALRTKIGS